MQYLCVQCDERFELQDGEKVRCPKCMRVKSVRRVEAASKAGAPKWLWPAAGALLVGLAVGGYLFQQSRPPDKPGEVAAEPISVTQVQRHLTALSIDAQGLSKLLEPGPQVEAFARAAAGGKASPTEKGQAVVQAVRARAQAGAFVPWSMIDALPREPMTAEQTAGVLAKDGGRAHLYPLEVAALAVAALRAVDVDAMLAEAFGFEGDRSPPDPSGRLGYLVVQAADRVLDPYAGRTQAPLPNALTTLTDLEAIGVALGLRALHRLGHARDPGGALQDADAALRLAPSSPSMRGVRAAVLIASGGGPEGQRETEAALQMRADAARRNNAAMISLAAGDPETAAREVSLALEQYPDYASAHVTLASVQMVSLERAQARASLEKAEALDPQMPTLPLAWAQLHLEGGEVEQAIVRGEQAVKQRPDNPQVHLMMGRIYRQASRYDDMRRAARRVMELVPDAQKQPTRDVIRQLLGPTAFESIEEEDALGATQPPAADGLDLAKGSSLLGSDEAEPEVRLLDDGADNPLEGSLQLPSDMPKLQLGEGSKLLDSEP